MEICLNTNDKIKKATLHALLEALLKAEGEDVATYRQALHAYVREHMEYSEFVQYLLNTREYMPLAGRLLSSVLTSPIISVDASLIVGLTEDNLRLLQQAITTVASLVVSDTNHDFLATKRIILPMGMTDEDANKLQVDLLNLGRVLQETPEQSDKVANYYNAAMHACMAINELSDDPVKRDEQNEIFDTNCEYLITELMGIHKSLYTNFGGNTNE